VKVKLYSSVMEYFMDDLTAVRLRMSGMDEMLLEYVCSTTAWSKEHELFVQALLGMRSKVQMVKHTFFLVILRATLIFVTCIRNGLVVFLLFIGTAKGDFLRP
jgi:hypothetical protein